MRHLIVTVITVLFSVAAKCHPAWGIAVAKNGTIYFADLYHNQGTIWSFAKGNLTPLLKNAHVHSLLIHADGDLYAATEHEQRSDLLRIRKDGRIDTVLSSMDYDHFFGSQFTIDHKMRVYFLHNDTIRRVSRTGEIPEPIYPAKHSSGLFTSNDGSVWFAMRDRNGYIYRINNGKVELFATDINKTIGVHSNGQPFYFGMYATAEAELFLAEYKSRSVYRVTKGNKPQKVFVSEMPWHPIGISIADSILYVLEVGPEDDKPNLGPRIVQSFSNGERRTVVNVNLPSERLSKNPPSKNVTVNRSSPSKYILPAAAFIFAIAGIVFFLRKFR
jgi:hypothetical protein